MSSVIETTYAGVPVLELKCRDIAVAMRIRDRWINATQVLKVAGVPHEKRSQFDLPLFSDGLYERVQGNYGRYQGTWIPFDKAFQLCQLLGVKDDIQPLFDFAEQETSLMPPSKKPRLESVEAKKEEHDANTPPPTVYYENIGQADKEKVPLEVIENHRALLMSVFLDDQNNVIPAFLHDIPTGMDVNMTVDDERHTALHWSAALAKLSMVKVLIEKGANPSAINSHGHSPLMRAVLVTNNYENQSFGELLSLLPMNIMLRDEKQRNIFHHTTLIACVQGREAAVCYYANCAVDLLRKDRLICDLPTLLNAQDVNGDTPLTIAARIGNDDLAKLYSASGADSSIRNYVGMCASDFGKVVKREDPLASTLHPTSSVSIPPYLKVLSARDTQAAELKKELNITLEKLDKQFNISVMEQQTIMLNKQQEASLVAKDLNELRQKLLSLRSDQIRIAETIEKVQNLRQAILHAPPLSANPHVASTEDLETLRQHVAGYEQYEHDLDQKLQSVSPDSMAIGFKCKKLIASCCNLPLEHVDQIIESLFHAIEAEKGVLNLERVATFVARMKNSQ